jgi:nucleoside diphosphate kinase
MEMIFNYIQNLILILGDTEKPVTICIIKPDILQNNKTGEVLAALKEKGYEIVKDKEVTMTDAQAREFYSHKASSVIIKIFIKLIH